QEVIFDKYKQVDKQADGRLYTTGLGLAFCKLAVEAHHGSVGVESTPGEGSKFYFVVPVE
ncbi:MAG: histidine kinase, partial [Deltaproteobacteria bacterium]|nr:histidine kinase [Deltaproteobacteria bacterium]